jgi:Predicted integral membrane protein
MMAQGQTRFPVAAGFAVILGAAALAAAPEVLWGSSCGHDFDFHLVSWFDALNAWRHDIPYPHWTPSANYGAGEPRFIFYSPLTWMLGAALGAVLPWKLVPLTLTFVLLAGTGMAARALARYALSEGAATLAGCIAIFSGYPLFTAYERSAFAELAGGIWLPLVFLFALRRDDESEAGWRRMFNGAVVPLALAVAGAWLSNPTVGVMACYTLAVIALVAAILARSWWPVLRAGTGAVLGMLLCAAYLLPAAWEQHWVDIHQVTEDPGQTLENNWIFARHANPGLVLHDQVLHTASTIAVAMFALTAAALLLCRFRGCLPGPRRWWVPLALVPFAVLLLQFPFSGWFWNHLPDLRFLQFPWRWLLVLESPMAIFLAASLWPTSGKPVGSRVVIAALCCIASALVVARTGRHFYQPCYVEDTVPSMIDVLRSGRGYIGTNEYEPIGANIALIAQNLPQACLVSDPKAVLGRANTDGALVWDVKQQTCAATYAASPDSRPEHMHIRGTAPRAGFLVVRQLTFPAWQVTLNGQQIWPHPSRKDGLLAIPVPQGSFLLTSDWTATPDVILARWISCLGVLLLTCLCVLERRMKRARLS